MQAHRPVRRLPLGRLAVLLAAAIGLVVLVMTFGGNHGRGGGQLFSSGADMLGIGSSSYLTELIAPILIFGTFVVVAMSVGSPRMAPSTRDVVRGHLRLGAVGSMVVGLIAASRAAGPVLERVIGPLGVYDSYPPSMQPYLQLRQHDDVVAGTSLLIATVFLWALFRSSLDRIETPEERRDSRLARAETTATLCLLGLVLLISVPIAFSAIGDHLAWIPSGPVGYWRDGAPGIGSAPVTAALAGGLWYAAMRRLGSRLQPPAPLPL